MAAEKPPISFDEEGRVRVLGAAHFRATQELEEEARAFAQSACPLEDTWRLPPARPTDAAEPACARREEQ
jgi:hypothetical protein